MWSKTQTVRSSQLRKKITIAHMRFFSVFYLSTVCAAAAIIMSAQSSKHAIQWAVTIAGIIFISSRFIPHTSNSFLREKCLENSYISPPSTVRATMTNSNTALHRNGQKFRALTKHMNFIRWQCSLNIPPYLHVLLYRNQKHLH